MPDPVVPDGTLVGNMRADLSTAISGLAETVNVQRAQVSYDAQGRGTPVWVTVGALDGDWQPYGGTTKRSSTGIEIEYEARFITAYNADVQEDDRILHSNGSFEYVVHVKKYTGHITLYLSKCEGSE
ncbi:MAG: hypothetical protein M0R74_20165 [Dehalococcoidia bacterium]|nr:hypothetical protein [Dehalococcoidia bacterium]